jgi:hypothetical protein
MLTKALTLLSRGKHLYLAHSTFTGLLHAHQELTYGPPGVPSLKWALRAALAGHGISSLAQSQKAPWHQRGLPPVFPPGFVTLCASCHPSQAPTLQRLLLSPSSY